MVNFLGPANIRLASAGLEMLRKAVITGLIMFVSPGSLMQIVVALLACLGFMTASAWYQPYVSGAANYFKVGTEVTLLVTLLVTHFCRWR